MRQLLKNRITRKGVRAYLAPDGVEVHLVFPKGLTGSPFKSPRLMEDVEESLEKEEGYIITFTPYFKDIPESLIMSRLVGWEEVIL